MQAEPTAADARRLVPVKNHPGIYKRGDSYVVRYRDPQGRGRKRFARTLAEARELRATLAADVARGEYRSVSRITFLEYAKTWAASYQGRTSRGIRRETLTEYRPDLGLSDNGDPLLGADGRAVGAVAFFGRMQLTAIEPRDIKAHAVHVASRGVSPGTVRLALAPVRVLLATAFEEGVIRTNPAAS